MKRGVVAIVAVALLAGCGGKTRTTEDRVLDALSATELQSRSLNYRVAAPAGEVGVAVTVEDDYRYESELVLDGEVAYREVVFDDALAAQLVDAAAVDLLGQAPGAATALKPGAWLIDDLGAPPSVPAAAAVGADPIVDALAYFTYVREATRASAVQEFDDDALDYRPDEDPFDHPVKGEKRYDVLPTELPARAAIERGTTTDVPDLSDLRKLSIFVRDGEVVRVEESIDVKPFAPELRRALHLPDASDRELLARVNELRDRIGQLPIEKRHTTLEVTDQGKRLRVELPTGEAAKLALHVGDVVTAPA